MEHELSISPYFCFQVKLWPDSGMFKHNGKEEDGCGRGVDSGILSLIKKMRKHAELQSDLIMQVSAVFQSMEGFLTSAAHLSVFSCFP